MILFDIYDLDILNGDPLVSIMSRHSMTLKDMGRKRIGTDRSSVAEILMGPRDAGDP